MKIRFCLIFAMIALLVSCDNGSKDERTYTEIDAPAEIAERAYSFAELYEQSDTEYHLGGQDPVRAIQKDCSGLIIMCYKYALVDTKYQLLVSDMTANYMYTNASTDLIGFASGIFYGKLHKSLISFITDNLPAHKKAFVIYTCGQDSPSYITKYKLYILLLII